MINAVTLDKTCNDYPPEYIRIAMEGIMTIYTINRENNDIDHLDGGIIEQEVNNVAIGVILVLAVMIGIWGVACLFGGLVGSEGVFGFVQSWVTAVTGG